MGFENMRNTLNVVMKDTKKAGETFKWAVDFANATPFETNEVVGATVKLQSYGLTAKDVLTDIGNMAGVMNKDLDSAVEAVADAQTGELERLKNFGITKQQIIDHANKIMKDKEIVNNKGQIVDQENFNKTLFSLMKERFKGGMELQAKTLKGSISTMRGVISNTLATLAGVTEDGTVKAGGAIDILKKKVIEITAVVQKWAKDGGVKRACKNIENGFKIAGNAVKFLKNNMNWLIPVMAGTVAGIKAFKIITTVKSLMTAWKTTTIAVKIAQMGLNATILTCPLTWIVVGIAAVVAAGVALWMNWDKVKEKCGELRDKLHESWSSIKEKCANVCEHVKEKWNSVVATFNNVKEKCAEFCESIKEKWSSLKTFLAHPIQGTISLVQNGDLSGVTAGKPHKTGLNRVPYDGYKAILHEGERVLTKQETDELEHNNLNSNNATINLNIQNMVVREEADINKIANALARIIKNDSMNYAF